MTDIELLDQYALGKSREALGEMVRRHVGWVHAVARRRVGDTGLADDVTQAVFLVLAQKPPSVREERAFVAWLFSVVNNACNRAIRGEMRRKKREKAFAMDHAEAGDSSSEMSQDYRIRHLSEGIDRLLAVRRLLDNVERQTGLSFSISEHLLPVWVGSPQAGL